MGEDDYARRDALNTESRSKYRKYTLRGEKEIEEDEENEEKEKEWVGSIH